MASTCVVLTTVLRGVLARSGSITASTHAPRCDGSHGAVLRAQVARSGEVVATVHLASAIELGNARVASASHARHAAVAAKRAQVGREAVRGREAWHSTVRTRRVPRRKASRSGGGSGRGIRIRHLLGHVVRCSRSGGGGGGSSGRGGVVSRVRLLHGLLSLLELHASHMRLSRPGGVLAASCPGRSGRGALGGRSEIATT